jgi:hypothetical protein
VTESTQSIGPRTGEAAGPALPDVDGAEALAGHPEVRTLSAPAVGPGPGSWIRPGLFSTSAVTVLASAEQLLSAVFRPGLAARRVHLGRRGRGGHQRGRWRPHRHGPRPGRREPRRPSAPADRGRRPTGLERLADRSHRGWATHHGGPWPATTDPLHTSVGVHPMRRFLRRVAYQFVPDQVLPASLREDNPLGLTRRVDGVLVPGEHAGVAP